MYSMNDVYGLVLDLREVKYVVSNRKFALNFRVYSRYVTLRVPQDPQVPRGPQAPFVEGYMSIAEIRASLWDFTQLVMTQASRRQ